MRVVRVVLVVVVVSVKGRGRLWSKSGRHTGVKDREDGRPKSWVTERSRDKTEERDGRVGVYGTPTDLHVVGTFTVTPKNYILRSILSYTCNLSN